MRLLLQILKYSRRISQATPLGGCLKAQLACLLHTTKLLLQKCWCSRRPSQATPPVGRLKAQLTCFNSYNDFTTKCMCSRRLSQATPPVRCLKAQKHLYFTIHRFNQYEAKFYKMLGAQDDFPKLHLQVNT